MPTEPKIADGEVQGSKLHQSPASKNASFCVCPDLIFAGLFVGAVATQLSLCWSYGYDKVNAASPALDDDTAESTEGRKNVLKIFACCCAFALLFAQVFIKTMVWCGAALLKCMVFTCVGLLALMAGMCLTYDLPYMAIPFACLAVGVGLYFWVYMHHLEFAGACLEVSCEVVNKYPTLGIIALAMVFALSCWSMVFATAQVGLMVYAEQHHTPTGKIFGMWAGIVFIYYWGQQAMRNTVVVTAAGTTAAWWWKSNSELGAFSAASWDALRRALTYHLGTIAFGSAFAAAAQTVCHVLNALSKQCDRAGTALACASAPASPCLACVVQCCCCAVRCGVQCCSCVVRCVQRCLEKFNFYAYVVVGIYGYGYLHAGGHVLRVFSQRGLLLVEEGSLVSAVLTVGVLSVALTTGAAAALAAKQNPHWTEGYPNPVFGVGLVGTLIGYGIAHTLFAVVEAANAAVFICYIENPHALERDHPSAYKKLHAAWVGMGKKEVAQDRGGAPAVPGSDGDMSQLGEDACVEDLLPASDWDTQAEEGTFRVAPQPRILSHSDSTDLELIAAAVSQADPSGGLPRRRSPGPPKKKVLTPPRRQSKASFSRAQASVGTEVAEL